MTAFRILRGKGFHITFDSGWTVSVQFGAGNYSDNYDEPISEASHIQCGKNGSRNAEVWCWNTAGDNWPRDPLGYQTPEQVAAVIACAVKGDFSDLEDAEDAE